MNKIKLSGFAIIILSVICFVIAGPIALIVLSLSNARDNQDHVKQQEMVDIVLEWGRLTPFPSNAANILIETEGNSFTRSFRISFTAPKEDIQAWLQASPGPTETTAEEISANKFKYVITPGGGANQAEVMIDYTLNKVEIYVSWS